MFDPQFDLYISQHNSNFEVVLANTETHKLATPNVPVESKTTGMDLFVDKGIFSNSTMNVMQIL